MGKLLLEEQRLARTNPEQFNKHKDNTLSFLDGFSTFRSISGITIFNPEDETDLSIVQDIYSRISFFWLTWGDAIRAFQDTDSLDVIYAKILLISFEDI